MVEETFTEMELKSRRITKMGIVSASVDILSLAVYLLAMFGSLSAFTMYYNAGQIGPSCMGIGLCLMFFSIFVRVFTRLTHPIENYEHTMTLSDGEVITVEG